ncbi:WSC domain-containing protein [Achaetomium macrosporum]|uniref:WSC domain-containing protein n=1 Tax=Achaetomium macrosporum TaxID=79813 RepID=A0AAN7C8R6_9PEZI|nr:WSC domain-containing protein [Achaetomium macrosporum]
MHAPSLLSFLLPLAASVTIVQQQPSSATSAPAITATNIAIYTAPSSGYVYHGCYNETTGLSGTTGARALSGGANLVAPGNMTVEMCWQFCRTGAGDSEGGTTGRFRFAGLEYARECWCAQEISTLSSKFPDSACDLPCEGNNTQACGGNLKLTVYMAGSTAAARVAWATGLVAVGAVSLTLFI